MRRRTLCLALLLAGCSQPGTMDTDAKIGFDLSTLDENGYEETAAERRFVVYELCIPARDEYVRQVRIIDPTLQMHPGSAGQIGCAPDQILAIGNTRQAAWRDALERLAALRYVKRIGRRWVDGGGDR